MAKGMRQIFVAAVAIMCMCGLLQPVFLPPAGLPMHRTLQAPAAAAGAAAIFAAVPAALAEPIDIAAKKFADVVYPVVKEIDWVKSPEVVKWITTNGATGTAWNPSKLNFAIRKVLEDGMAMDPVLVREAVEAHKKAITVAATAGSNLAAPIENVEEVVIALAKMIASAGPEKNQAVYEATMALGAGKLNSDFFADLAPVDTSSGFKAFLELAQVARQSV